MRHVENEPRWAKFFAKNFVIILTALSGLTGIVLLHIASVEEVSVLHSELVGHAKSLTIRHYLIRDAGITLVVAALVTLLYEFHARTKFYVHTVSDVFDIIMSDFVDEDLWGTIREIVTKEKFIRRDFAVTLAVERHDGLPQGQCILSVLTSYVIHSTKSQPQSIHIEHHLDSHVRNEALELPRFQEVMIVPGKIYNRNDKEIKKDEIRLLHLINPKGGEPLRVSVERQEIINVPGTYILTFRNLTSHISIHLKEIPPEIKVQVLIFPPHQSERNLYELTKDNMIGGDQKDKLCFLPGQVLEFRFSLAEDPPAQDKRGDLRLS